MRRIVKSRCEVKSLTTARYMASMPSSLSSMHKDSLPPNSTNSHVNGDSIAERSCTFDRRVEIDDVSQMNKTHIDRLFQVRNLDDIRFVIREAIKNQKHVSVRGQAHTMGGQSITQGGYVIDMKYMNRMELLAPQEGTHAHNTNNNAMRMVRVECGATWGELLYYLNQFGLAPMIMQSYCSFSIGGTISVNAHGVTSDFAMHESIVSIELVNDRGEIVVCDNVGKNQHLFRNVVGGFGLFGVLHSVTLKVVPNSKMYLESALIKQPEHFKHYYEQLLNDDSVEVKIARINITNMRDIYLTVFRKIGNSNTGTISDLGDEPKQMSLLYRLIYKWFIPLHIMQKVRYALEGYLHRPLDWDGHGDRNVLMYESADSLAKLWQPLIPLDRTFILQEYFVPHDHFVPWMEELNTLFRSNKLKLSKLLNITIRYIRKDQTSNLPYAPSNMFSFVFYYRTRRTTEADEELRAIHMKLNDMALKFSGTFYLPYRHHYSLEQLCQAYPNISELFQNKALYDKSNLFSNTWYQAWAPRFIERLQNVIHSHSLENQHETTPLKMSDIEPHRDRSLIEVIRSIPLKKKFEKFLFTVFNIENPRALLALTTRIVWSKVNKTDLDVYQELQDTLRNRSPAFYFTARNAYMTVRQLVDQRKEISDEVVSIVSRLGMAGAIQSYASFGDAGRLVQSLKKKLKMKGKTYVIHDKQNIMDIIERGSIRSVGTFISFDYNNVNDINIESNSVDLVTISMGLHHFRVEKLDTVLQLVYRILKPGGVFIFREHDARPEIIPLLDAAHTIFNAVTGVPLEEESSEIRLFRSVNEWRSIVTASGFQDSYLYELQHDDPTEDFMLCFTKPIAPLMEQTLTSQLDDIRHDLTSKGIQLIQSNSASSYFRLNEWMIVRFVKEYAAFLNHTPWYQFPYNRYTKLFWQSLMNNTLSVARTRGWRQALTDPGMVMNGVMATVLTLFFSQLSLLALPIKLALGSGQKKVEVEQLIISSRHLIEWSRIDQRITVKKVLKLPSVIGNVNHDEIVSGLIQDHEKRSYVSLLEIPRHQPFTEILMNMVKTNREPVELLQISGQSDDLLVEILVLEQQNMQISEEHVNSVITELKQKVGDMACLEVLYQFQYPNPEIGGIHVALKVQIPKLLQVLAACHNMNNVIRVIQAYDFI